jgi:peroxiredoxin family protein
MTTAASTLVRLPGRASVEDRLAKLEREFADERRSGLAIAVSSGGLDDVMSSLMLATTSASMGQEVQLFFTFWAVSALRRADAAPRRVGWVDRILGRLLPRGSNALCLSTMHWAGAGTAMMRSRMKQKGLASCDELIAMAAESGVRISVCAATLDLLGLSRADLIDYPNLELCGAATFLAIAQKSATTIFI